MVFIHKKTGELALVCIKSLQPPDQFCVKNKCFLIAGVLVLTNADEKNLDNFEFIGFL